MPPKLQQRLLRSAVQRKKERDVHKALYQGERRGQGERGENIRDRVCIDHIAADISKKKWEEGLSSAICAAAGGCWT